MLQTAMLAVQGYYIEESAETLTLFQNKVREQVLQDFAGYNPELTDEIFVKRSFM